MLRVRVRARRKFTRESALKECIELWEYIQKTEGNPADIKSEYYRERYPKFFAPVDRCPLCEYVHVRSMKLTVNKVKGPRMCELCPVTWGQTPSTEEFYFCVHTMDSPYLLLINMEWDHVIEDLLLELKEQARYWLCERIIQMCKDALKETVED